MGGCTSSPSAGELSALPPDQPAAAPAAGASEPDDDGTSPLDTLSPTIMFGAMHGRRVAAAARGLRFAFEVGGHDRGWLVDCARGDAVVVSRYSLADGAPSEPSPPTAIARYRDVAVFRAIEGGARDEVAAIMHGEMHVRGDLPAFHALDGMWREMKATLGAPPPAAADEASALLGAGGAPSGVSAATLTRARKCAIVFEFFMSMSWGIWQVTYTYTLTEVGGYTDTQAAFYSTYQWLCYAIAQVGATKSLRVSVGARASARARSPRRRRRVAVGGRAASFEDAPCRRRPPLGH